MSKEIFLSRGRTTLVDDEDYEWLSLLKWHLSAAGTGYAERNLKLGFGKTNRKLTKMHRVIMENHLRRPLSRVEIVDHINGNSLDNRKSNLRICTFAENTRNRNLSPKNTSGFPGVVWNKRLQKWVAQIGFNYHSYHIGVFSNINEAAEARRKVKEKLHGKF